MKCGESGLVSRRGLGVLAGIGAAALAGAVWRRRRHLISFEGRVVLITGGSRGLGFALAKEFAARGARVVICGRNASSLQEAARELSAAGTDIMTVQCDISNLPEVESLIGQATDRFGGVDVLVNNAGQIAVGPLASQTLEDFQRALDTMFWGMVYTTMAVLPQMKRRRSGRIVNITSIGGKVAVPHLLPYSCAKFAAAGFSEGLRAEAAKDRVWVTTVVPGLMRTGSHTNALFKGDHRKEFAWFSLAATSPMTSMDAHRAARRIVDAAARGAAEIVLTPQARLLALAHGVAPGMVSDIMGTANRLMPGTGNCSPRAFTGKESETAISKLLTSMGRQAERELNQHPEWRRAREEEKISARSELSQSAANRPGVA